MFFRITNLILAALTTAILTVPSGANAARGGLEMRTEASPVAGANSRAADSDQCGSVVDCALECLEERGDVTGAVTDGATKVTFTVSGGEDGNGDPIPLDPGTVKIFLMDGSQAPEDGGFGAFDSEDRNQEVTVQVQEGLAKTEYFVPESFGSSAPDPRVIKWGAEYTPASGGETLTGGPWNFNVWRPALVLMHGLWSGQETWNKGMFNSGVTSTVDYSDTAGAAFSVNRDKAAEGILDACEGMRRTNEVAMRKVDFAGHSMGALLGRNFEAAHPGYINKIFSLNSPHNGSPMGNALAYLRDEKLKELICGDEPGPACSLLAAGARFALIKFMESGLINKPIVGAIDDLARGSTAINAIQATPVPSHALAGTGGSDVLDPALNTRLFLILDILRYFQSVDIIDKGLNIADAAVAFMDCTFAGQQHDLIVGFCSQQGNIAESARSPFSGFSSIHTSVTQNPDYTGRINELLDLPSSESEFAEFPAPSSYGNQPHDAAACVDTLFSDLGVGSRGHQGAFTGLTLSGEELITFAEPIQGTVVAPLDEVTVTVEPVGSYQPTSVIIGSPDVDDFLEFVFEPPFTATLWIPEDYTGELNIIAQANDGTTETETETTIVVQPATDSELEEIWIDSSNPVVMVGPGDNRQMLIKGLYSDGVTRNITDSSAGTTYTSSDQSVVQVSANGELMPQALEDSETTVIVKNGDLETVLDAVVLGTPLDEIFDDNFQIVQ